ncbi:MAG TPA: MerR family transcriptional regulator [Gammaproteobacteria bacterium]|nr:MerR family transcriptional regulator [Gammaproteobacteria bacterium]
MDIHLSPAETARRFGISIKALRLYEQHGLLKPLRTANGSTGTPWRVYGSDQIARLHQILALKRLGLSLGQIGRLLAGADALDPILAAQERVLAKERERITRALALIRKARTKLAAGDVLSVDDLATLTHETAMTKPSTAEELNEILTPFRLKHLTPQEQASLEEVKKGASAQPDDVKKSMKAMTQLLEEARTLMTSGDATTAAAMDFARRFRATGKRLKNSAPSALTGLKPKLKAMMDDARSDPDVSQKFEVLAFVEEALANLKAKGDDTESQER